MPDIEVSAAGGVVVRSSQRGPEIALVHRPRYDDWSLPKGKLTESESFEAAAVREVAEETVLECNLGPELTPSRYTDQKGRQKLVRWWLMKPTAGDFIPNDEVDELRWCTHEEAAALLDYPDQIALVEEALAQLS